LGELIFFYSWFNDASLAGNYAYRVIETTKTDFLATFAAFFCQKCRFFVARNSGNGV
jgi:hypothetical protein